MRRIGIVSGLLALVGMAPAGADPQPIYFVARGHLVEAYQVEGSMTEVQLFAGQGEVLADSAGEPYEERFGCISIFRDYVIEEGCGEVGVSADPLLQLTGVEGTMETTVYTFDPETITFTPIGESAVHLGLTLPASSEPRLAHSEFTGVGVCGLPPETRGAWVQVETPLQRDAGATGTLHSVHFGNIDPAILAAKVSAATFAVAGACV